MSLTNYDLTGYQKNVRKLYFILLQPREKEAKLMELLCSGT
jgi:hypothetical protein